MRMIKMLSAAAAAGVLALGAATAANATIVNIDAKTTGVDVTLAPGQYLIQWVGIAGGGAFDGYNPSCASGECTSGWSDAFAGTDVPFDPNGSIDFFNLSPPGGFSSAGAALSAVQSAAAISHGEVDLTSGVPGPFTLLAPIPQPWILTTAGGTFHLFAPDNGDKNLDNNFGGVSLSFTAVPEPATWGLMLLGFGGLGAMLRNRRKATGAFA